jgi:hypothetical protein
VFVGLELVRACSGKIMRRVWTGEAVGDISTIEDEASIEGGRVDDEDTAGLTPPPVFRRVPHEGVCQPVDLPLFQPPFVN